MTQPTCQFGHEALLGVDLEVEVSDDGGGVTVRLRREGAQAAAVAQVRRELAFPQLEQEAAFPWGSAGGG